MIALIFYDSNDQLSIPNHYLFMFSYNMSMEETKEFKDWLNDRYIEWRGNSRSTITEFAAYLGVSQSLLSHWLNGKMTPRDPEKIAKLVMKFGIDTYRVLGYYIPPGEHGVNLSVERKAIALEEVNAIFREASEAVKNIEDPSENLKAYAKFLTENGLHIFQAGLKFRVFGFIGV